jgi:AcrR family transcriptional regulator
MGAWFASYLMFVELTSKWERPKLSGTGGTVARTYDNRRRAAAAADTTTRIAFATEQLLTQVAVAEVSLQAIADVAGVTVQTVLRHMGSRDGCFAAVHELVMARIQAQRGQSAPGDVAGALAGLLSHYEADSRLVLNLLAQEYVDPFARAAAVEGRAVHRAWVEHCFGCLLAPDARDERVDALVAATDLFVWKLLRLDLGRSADETSRVIHRAVRALLEQP